MTTQDDHPHSHPVVRAGEPIPEVVTELRTAYMCDALHNQDVKDRYQEPVMQARSRRPRREVPQPVLDAWMSSLSASTYAYTLAAVLAVAEREFGRDVAERLACVADNIITNGDDGDVNADVTEAARRKLHPEAGETA